MLHCRNTRLLHLLAWEWDSLRANIANKQKIETTAAVRQESSFTRQLLMHKMCYATEKMGVGPPDSHYRMWVQTTISCFGQKPRWLALWEKARLWLRQVRARELNETEPVLTCRKVWWCHQNQVALLTWEESGRYPVYWPDGDRHIAGRNLAQASL
jgi:hypothetical protein